ncbi:hypothetical protein IMX07_10350 [bacterium]|nr:hypothetical protein [bacterium]
MSRFAFVPHGQQHRFWSARALGGGSRPTLPPMLYRFFHYVAAQFLGVLLTLVPNMQDSVVIEQPVIGHLISVQEEFIDPIEPGTDGYEERMAPNTPDDDDFDENSDRQHTKNKRQSTKDKHEQEQRRKKMDRPGGEKGDEYRKRYKGLWWYYNQGNGMI